MKYDALLPAPPEMRAWCSILTEKMLQWPGVTVSHVFGTCAFYHRKVMFAMLPDKRGLDNPYAISFKTSSGSEDEVWHIFELKSDNRVNVALALLEKAYNESVLHPFPKPSSRSKQWRLQGRPMEHLRA